MPTFVMVTRIDDTAMSVPKDREELEKAAVRRIELHCPDVIWRENLVLIGPWDYLDLFEAPDMVTAQKVAMIVRSFGHARTEVWPATQWTEFREAMRGVT